MNCCHPMLEENFHPSLAGGGYQRVHEAVAGRHGRALVRRGRLARDEGRNRLGHVGLNELRGLFLGRSADLRARDPVVIAGYGGRDRLAPAVVVSKRPFAGAWEYLLDEAIFTTPPHPAWSGAALISRDGKLLGVGSLIVGDATGNGSEAPGNA